MKNTEMQSGILRRSRLFSFNLKKSQSLNYIFSFLQVKLVVSALRPHESCSFTKACIHQEVINTSSSVSFRDVISRKQFSGELIKSFLR